MLKQKCVGVWTWYSRTVSTVERCMGTCVFGWTSMLGTVQPAAHRLRPRSHVGRRVLPSLLREQAAQAFAQFAPEAGAGRSARTRCDQRTQRRADHRAAR